MLSLWSICILCFSFSNKVYITWTCFKKKINLVGHQVNITKFVRARRSLTTNLFDYLGYDLNSQNLTRVIWQVPHVHLDLPPVCGRVHVTQCLFCCRLLFGRNFVLDLLNKYSSASSCFLINNKWLLQPFWAW